MMPDGELQWPGYVVVEGPIGSGKTSLAKRLAESVRGEMMLEGAEENPFLDRFYQTPEQAALPTQLFFLFQRYRQLEPMRQGDLFRNRTIADFMIEKDRLFAEMILSDDEYKLYDQVQSTLDLNFTKPDLVVYLQAPVDVLMHRIQKRGRPMEKAMDMDYLQRLVDAYTNFFYHYEDAPLLIVNASEVDLVNNDNEFQELLRYISTLRRGRHYFNPMPIAL